LVAGEEGFATAEDERVDEETVVRVFEKTIFGSSFQMRANSSSCWGAEGLRSSAVPNRS
jgi:hypothetical protein